MNALDTVELSNSVNALNAHRMAAVHRRVHAFLGVMLAVAMAIGGAFAVIHFGTPCEGASLCMAAVIPTRPNWLQRLLLNLQAWRLRMAIRSAQQDLAHQHMDLDIARWECEAIPKQQAVLRAHIDMLAAQLDALELQGAR